MTINQEKANASIDALQDLMKAWQKRIASLERASEWQAAAVVVAEAQLDMLAVIAMQLISIAGSK